MVHYKEPNRLQRFFLYGGNNKQGYKEIRELINVENYKVWRILSVILEVLFFGLFIYTLCLGKEYLNMCIPFGILAGTFIFICLAFFLFLKPTSKALLPIIHITLIITFSAFIYIALQPNNFSNLYFFVFLTVFSFLIIDRPYRYPLFALLFCSILFILAIVCFDGTHGYIYTADIPMTNPNNIKAVVMSTELISIGLLAIISSLLSMFSNYIRTKELSLRRKAEIDRDIDTLTGIKNKLAYEKRVNDISNCIDNELDLHFAVAVFDVNGLKKTNDTYGHEAGDQLLIRACNMIVSTFVHSELYRIGGDEFALIITDEDYVNREKLTRGLHEKISRAHKNAESLLDDTSIAFGIALYNYVKDDSYNSVFTRADSEMYNNKKITKANNEFLTPKGE